jgi:hypothetical protein
MGAGASSNKHRSIDAKEEMIQRLDNEQALSDAARDSFASSGSNSSDGRGGGSGERTGNGRTTSISPTIPEESTEGKRSSSPKTKRRPMPIPMHVFQSDDHLQSNAKPFPKTPRSPSAIFGQEKFRSLLSLDDSEITKFQQASSPRAVVPPSPRRLRSGSSTTEAAKRSARRGKKLRSRNNSTSSWYSVKTTMGSAPKDATIRCIATVILRHMSAHRRSESASLSTANSSRWQVFNDSPEVYTSTTSPTDSNYNMTSTESKEGRSSSPRRSYDESEDGSSSGGGSIVREGRSIFRGQRTPRGKGTFFGSNDNSDDKTNFQENVLPSVRRIREFIEYVFNKAQLEIDGLIIAFIYLERLLEKASYDGVNLLYAKNWRTICFISLVLASKIWDDFSMDNGDFAVVWQPTTVKRVNQLERKVLEVLRYNVSIPASDYAACYFKLRSLVTSLGLKEVR